MLLIWGQKIKGEGYGEIAYGGNSTTVRAEVGYSTIQDELEVLVC